MPRSSSPRRAVRHAFTLLSALSLLLCVAVIATWVCGWMLRVAQDEDLWKWKPVTKTSYGIALRSGELIVAIQHPPVSRLIRYPTKPEPVLGFNYYSDATYVGRGYVVEYSRAIIPPWFTASITAAMPLGWLVLGIRRRRKNAPGLCPDCGYDLRAHAGGGPAMSLSNPRCPECGAGIA